MVDLFERGCGDWFSVDRHIGSPYLPLDSWVRARVTWPKSVRMASRPSFLLECMYFGTSNGISFWRRLTRWARGRGRRGDLRPQRSGAPTPKFSTRVHVGPPICCILRQNVEGSHRALP